MALRTAHGQPQPDGAGRGHAVEDRLDAKLLLVGAPFGIGQRLPVKGRGQTRISGVAPGNKSPANCCSVNSIQRQVAR